MKLFTLIGAIVFSFIAFHASAQDFGYLGKKNIFSIFTTSNMRITPSLLGYTSSSTFAGEHNYRYHHISYDKNNKKIDKFKLFRVDYRVAYQRIVSRKVAIGAEFAYHKTTIGLYKPVDYDYNTNTNYSLPVSDPVFRTMTYILTAEFYNPRGFSGAGFSSQVGIGAKFYSFLYDENYRVSSDSAIVNPYPISTSNWIAINVFYELSYKAPLTSSLFFNIGMRLHTGFVLPKFLGYIGTKSTFWVPQDMFSDIWEDNLFNLASLKTGLVFEF